MKPRPPVTSTDFLGSLCMPSRWNQRRYLVFIFVTGSN
jgi:hypothetical protein